MAKKPAAFIDATEKAAASAATKKIPSEAEIKAKFAAEAQPKESPQPRSAPQKSADAKAKMTKKAGPTGVPEADPSEKAVFVSRHPETSPFKVAGYRPIRNFSTGQLEWHVPADDAERVSRNHFVNNGRVVRRS